MVHVIPTADIHPHEESTLCQCNPIVDTTGAEIIVIHNAFDGREGVEITNEILKQRPC